MPYSRSDLSEIFSTNVPEGYTVFSKDVERHGRWEWIAVRSNFREANRYIAIFAIWAGESALESPFFIEVWAAADTQERFWRELIARLPGEDLSNVRSALADGIREAQQRAEDIQRNRIRRRYFKDLWEMSSEMQEREAHNRT